MKKMENIFSYIYEKNIWGNNNSIEYNGSSGGGSSIEYNINTYIPFLKNFIKNNDIKTVVDLGCGDFRCGKLIYDDLDVLYTGYDVYDKVITSNTIHNSLPKYTFFHLDFFTKKEDIVSGDLCILKDVIQHWSLDNIYNFLDYLVNSKKFKFILIVNCCGQSKDNEDTNNGGWRPLSSKFLPLKKYNAITLYKYETKEVSLITV